MGLSESLHLEATNVSNSIAKLPYKCNFKDKLHHLLKCIWVYICIFWYTQIPNVFHKIIPEICIVLDLINKHFMLYTVI